MMKVTQIDKINKFLEELNLIEFFSAPVMQHIINFLVSSITLGFNGKTTDIERISGVKQSTISKFFSEGKWDENIIDKILKKTILEKVSKESEKNSEPIFISIDDTVNPKKKPHRNSKKTIKGSGYLYSHLLGKCTWGQQIVATTISVGKKLFNYDLHLYQKNESSKIDYIVSMIKELFIENRKVYVLCDCWYSTKKIIDITKEKGYHLIGAIKSNRIIYPNNCKTSISDYGKSLDINEFDLVTVNSKEYYVHRVETRLNNVDKSVVLLSYKKDDIENRKYLKCFISTDLNLDTKSILNYYINRWKIEVFFKQIKNYFGFASCQMRSLKSIKRFYILILLVHYMCIYFSPDGCNLSEGVKEIRILLARRVCFLIRQDAQNKFNNLEISNDDFYGQIILLCA